MQMLHVLSLIAFRLYFQRDDNLQTPLSLIKLYSLKLITTIEKKQKSYTCFISSCFLQKNEGNPWYEHAILLDCLIMNVKYLKPTCM